MKSHNDKRLLLSLFALALFAMLVGRGFEILRFNLPGTTSINSAAALLATENNLAP